MRTESLESILIPSQLKELEKLLKRLAKQKLTPADPGFTVALKDLFRQWRADLEAKEIDPDYLAYSVAFILTSHTK